MKVFTLKSHTFTRLSIVILSLFYFFTLAMVVQAGTTNTIGSTTLSYNVPITIAAGNVTQSAGTLSLNAATTAQFNAVTGAGTLQLVSTTNNNSTYPDIYFNASDVVQANSTANDGTKISTIVDLGSLQRYVFGLTDHNGVGKYGASSGADCTFAGSIIGTGGITFVAQDNYTGSNPMECPFYLTAVNTFTGPVEIQRGAVYLGNASALTSGNVLRFNPATGNNARFFLYGNNASVSDLQSTGAGNSLIADGNLNPGNVGPSTLTIAQNNPFTYAGTITDIQSEYNATAGLTLTPTLSLVKNGTAALTLSGTMSYSGTTTVRAGKLYVNTTASGGGAVFVASGATLGGNGTIASLVTVSNGAAIEAGDGTGTGVLKLKAVNLGIGASDAITLNCGANTGSGVAGYLSVTNVNGLTNNGVVTINVSGNFPAATPATYTLISYSGSIKGIGSFMLGTVPDQAVGYITNNTAASAIQLVLSSVTLPAITWVGAPLNTWDLLGSNVWRQTGTTTPANYTNGSVAIFDDTASNFLVNVTAAISPASWLVTNSANNYVFSGAGGVASSGLTKTGSGTLTLNMSNSYSANTTIAAGKLVLGSVAAIPNGPGTVTVNGTLDLGGFSPTYNNLSGTGVVDNVTAGGSPVLTVSSTANPVFAGTIQNGTGSLALNVTGTGTFTLGATNNYSGGTYIGSLSTGGGTLALGTNNALPIGSALTIDNRSSASVLGLGGFNQNVGAITLYAGGSIRTIITGSGTLTLSSNLTLVDPHIVGGGQDYALAFNPVVDLNGATRTFTIGYGNNAESTDLGDLHLNGPITNSTGTAGLILAPWSSGGTTYYGSVLFAAANSYNGPTVLTGGTGTQGTSTLALNANNSIPNKSAFIQSANTILDLTAWGKSSGISTGMGSLTGAGTITLGSAGILTIGYDNTSPAAYLGSIGGAGGSIAKTGTGTLTLSGTNTYTGKTTVLNGTLLVNGSLTGGGAVVVSNGAALGGSGTIVSLVTVSNGATLNAGDVTGSGTLMLNSLTLGANSSDSITMNCTANPAGITGVFGVMNANGLTNNGTVMINVNGSLPATMPATYTILTYSGAIQGAGTFILGALPNQAVAYLTNNTAASAIQLVVSTVTIPSITWIGSPTDNWDLLGENVWKKTSDGTPAGYSNSVQTIFNDTASNFLVNVTAIVSPYGMVVSNSLNDYVFMGNGNVSGYSLTKQGGGKLFLNMTNSYTGNTTISAGKLVLGTAAAIPGGIGAGSVTVNGTLDLAGFSPMLNNLSGGGVVDNVSAGGSPILNLAGSGTSTFSGTIQNSSGSLELNYSGSSTLSLSGSNVYSGVTVINSGTLQVGAGGASGTLGAGAVLDAATLAFNRTDNYTNLNDIAGSGSVQQNGPGTVTLLGNLTFTGSSVVNAGVLAFPKDHTFDVSSGTTLNIAAGAMARISGTVVNLNVNSTSVAVDASGAGTMQLASTLNSIESYSDLNFGPNQSGTTDFGCKLACNLDLGSIHRTIYGWSGRNDVVRYGLTGCDCQFAGSIIGSAELTLRGQNSFAPGTNTMEVPFAFNGSNSFTGPLEIQRGSLYLGNVNALTQGNVLIFDPAQGVSSRLFLYGFGANVSDLQSTAYGTSVIANGNGSTSTNVGPATLTVTQNNPFTFNGNIVDWFTEYASPTAGSFIPTLSLVKNGLAALTFAGTNTYSGATTINGGKLYVNTSSTGGGAITVNTNATLGGNGIITSVVTVKNGGAIETGAGNRAGNLLLKGLTLGSANGDRSVLNLAASAVLNVTNNNGLVLNGGAGSVTINVGGNFAALGQYSLITYKGTLGGTGFSALQLGSLPAGVLGYLSNNTANASVDLIVSGVTVPRWTGALNSEWSVNNLSAPKNWVLSSDGVTAIDYVDGEAVLFNDTAANPTVNISAANVAPYSVTVSNTVQNYAIGGSSGITGSTSFTKQGSGVLTIGTADTYTGNTTISAGTLVLGSALAIPSGAGYGNLAVNGTLDLGGFSPTVNNLSGNGTVDNTTAGGSPVLTVMNNASTIFSGKVQNNSGTLSVNVAGGGVLTLSGTNTLNGSINVNSATLNVIGKIGSGGVALASSGTMSGTGIVTGSATLAGGSTLVLTANNPLTVGPLALNGKVTVTATGNIATNTPGTYVLLNHGAESGSGFFALVQLPWLASAGLSAQLVDTNNQLDLIIQPAALTGTIADVKHVVVFMQENRSFDTYFGTLHGVHGFSDRNALLLTTGSNDLYQPSGSGYELPYHTSVTCINDLDHSWGPTHNAIDNDRNDGWIANKGTETMAYYNRGDLPYYYQLADSYTVLDDYHCSVRASTDPNRLSAMTGMIDPNGTGAGTINGTTYPGGPVIDNTEPSVGWGPGWVTYPELLVKAGISWKLYQQTDNYDDNALAWFAVYKQATAGNPLHDDGNVFSANVVTQFQNDVTSNTLPAVSWIIGPTAQTEHPPYSTESGEALTKQFLDALASNPVVFSNTVFILCYDENDGFYDHAMPITPPAGTANEYVSGLPIGLGVRVPAIIISPWTRGGHVCSQVFDHTSILRFLETWTGVQEPNISAWRRQVTGDLTSAFDFAHPDYSYPSLPPTTPISCSSGSTPAVPSPQVVPTQEAGTLTPRPLPYQPNAMPVLNSVAGNISILMTNSGTASVHFLVIPNAYRTDNPTPYDVLNAKTATNVYSTVSTSGNYDLSCYGPNGFQRRFVGNVSADNNKIEAVSSLNPSTGGIEVTLANATASPVTFTITNGYVANGLTTYTVPAGTTTVISGGSETNNGFYDLTVTASADSLFLRRFLGRVETNGLSGSFVSSKNPSGYNDNVMFTTTITGYGTPTGTVQFATNGVALGTPVVLNNGVASLSTTMLLRGSNVITAAYSGDTLNQPGTNSLTQVVTNHPPVATPVFFARASGVTLLIKISNLLTNVTDADEDAITLVGVGKDGLNLLSTNGATLFNNGTYLLYTNSVTPNVNDGFNYTVSDGQGGTNVAALAILLNNNIIGQSNVRLTISSTNVAANFFGVPGFKYTVQRSTNLTQGLGWVPISTNTAPIGGLIQVLDGFQDLGIPVPPVPANVFYRLEYNP